MLDIQGQNVLVLGLGRSGLAAARFLAARGARVVVNDRRPADRLPDERRVLENYPSVRLVAGGHPLSLLDQPPHLIIKSPGIHPQLPLLQAAIARQIPVLSEIEMAYHYIKAPIIGITGTNGKTTTAMLAGEIMRQALGREPLVAGNIGLPLLAIAGDDQPTDPVVAEISSFQLLDIRAFRPLVAVVLNISEDHLDYHGSFDNYLSAKARILENQQASDYAVLNADDRPTSSLAARARSAVFWFSRRRAVENGAYLDGGGTIILASGGRRTAVAAASDLAIPGPHNLENALAAVTAAWCAGAGIPAIARALKSFRGVEHRLEYVLEAQGITYVNDSKGTNPRAAVLALQSLPGRKVLIAGGKDKGSGFGDFAAAVKEHVRHLVLLGETAPGIARAVEEAGFHNYTVVADLPAAVREARQRAVPGDTVLLSPACASWDMFKNFEERGTLFKRLVRELGQNG